MNSVKIKGNMYKCESCWREKKDKITYDDKGIEYPYPEENIDWSDKINFLNRLGKIENALKIHGKYTPIKKSKDCLLCDQKNVFNGYYNLKDIIWEDALTHYINVHNIKPSEKFMDKMYNFQYDKNKSEVLKLDGVMYKKDDLKYIKLDRNQIMIMDALMNHGGYKKKYIDPNNKSVYRYSEHAGLIDFNDTSVDKIIISGRTNRVDEEDDEIYLPKNIPDAYDYEYIFHTHPPTPKPGGRANLGILYEFPSISDIFHFIDHYNEGRTQGSIVISAEGLYNIRNLKLDEKKIKVNEDKMYKELSKTMNRSQNEAIEKYGDNFTDRKFFKEIAQNTDYINMINKCLEKYNIYIDYYPRVKDETGDWIIDTLYMPIYVVEPI